MTTENKLRFEIGEGFKKLSKDKLDEYETLFDDLMDQSEEEYGFSGDSPYYDATENFMYDILNGNLDEEDFIQVVINHNDYGTFGWALDNIEDKELLEFARKEMYNHLKNDDSIDEEDIQEILESVELPG